MTLLIISRIEDEHAYETRMTLSQATMILFLLSRVCHLAQNSRSRRVLSLLLYFISLPISLSTFLIHFTDSLFYLYLWSSQTSILRQRWMNIEIWITYSRGLGYEGTFPLR